VQPRQDATAHSFPVTTVRVPGFDIVTGVHEASSILSRHTHDDPTICCVQSGRFTEYYAGKAVDCDPRMLKVTPAGEPHWNRFNDVQTLGVRIDVHCDRFRESEAVTRMLGERLFFAAGAFAELTGQLLFELRQSDTVSELATEGLLLELIARMARAAEVRSGDLPAWLVRADEFVRESYRSPLTIATVAGNVGVRPATLAQAYRRAFGRSIADQVRNLRMEYAARALTSSAVPLAEIALRAGFYDQSHFSNAFKRHYGTTPAAYRRDSRRPERMMGHPGECGD
jgi:AraC family transcriptional regulator